MNTPHLEYTTVAIIGGGITGLSAAWYLQKAGIDYTLLEASERWGGKIRTEYLDGYGEQPFVIETGPDSMLAQKPWGWQLADELGLASRLLGTNDEQRNIYVLDKGKLMLMPDGLMLIVPTKFMPFVRTNLISPLGKLRMGLDLFIRPKRDDKDETLAEFIGRRLGKEALDKLAEPLLAGIYSAEPERLSIMATFPRFRAMEQKYGSLTRGMIAVRKNHATPSNNHAPKTVFVSFINGMNELVDALVSQLTGSLQLESSVENIIPAADGSYTLSLSDGSRLTASKVIMTTPANVSASLLNTLAPESAQQLKQIRYVATGTASLAFRREDVPHPLDG
ncbi:MAG: protoporphyrinogen oxidase, partial [Chloroflexi bacterium]